MILNAKNNLRCRSYVINSGDVKEVIDTDVKKGKRWISILITKQDQIVLITDLERKQLEKVSYDDPDPFKPVEVIPPKFSLYQRLRNLITRK